MATPRSAMATPRRSKRWGFGGHFGAHDDRDRGAPRLRPRRSERWGFGGHFGAHDDRDRGAPRLRRGAPSAGGLGAISGPTTTVIAERHGCAAALRAWGGLGTSG